MPVSSSDVPRSQYEPASPMQRHFRECFDRMRILGAEGLFERFRSGTVETTRLRALRDKGGENSADRAAEAQAAQSCREALASLYAVMVFSGLRELLRDPDAQRYLQALRLSKDGLPVFDREWFGLDKLSDEDAKLFQKALDECVEMPWPALETACREVDLRLADALARPEEGRGAAHGPSHDVLSLTEIGNSVGVVVLENVIAFLGCHRAWEVAVASAIGAAAHTVWRLGLWGVRATEKLRGVAVEKARELWRRLKGRG